jgi:hypothetical protein
MGEIMEDVKGETEAKYHTTVDVLLDQLQQFRVGRVVATAGHHAHAANFASMPSSENNPQKEDNIDEEMGRAWHYLLQKQRDITGYGLHPGDRRTEYFSLLQQVHHIEQQLHDAILSLSINYHDQSLSSRREFWSFPSSASWTRDTTETVRRTLSTMYGYLTLKRQQAQFLGYDSLVSQVFDTHEGHPRGAGQDGSASVVTLTQIEKMHDEVAGRLSPILNRLASRGALSSGVLSSYLSASGPPSGRGNRGTSSRPRSAYSDATDPFTGRGLKLEKHVTLEGVIKFATRIVSDLFGLLIVEDESGSESSNAIRAWHDSVRLFHVYTDSQERLVGSFFLDPLARPSKISRGVTSILYPPIATASAVSSADVHLRSSPVILGMSLSIDPPAWETEPVRMNWDGVVDLMHELGHVVDILLLQSVDKLSLGVIAGHSSLPIDRSEILPKFMEHWMTDASSIRALLEMSETTTPFSNAEIEVTLQQKSHNKCMQVAQNLFYGELELELFSSRLNLRKDSILALQRELAMKRMPHDIPSSQLNESFLAPLAEIFLEAVRGRCVSRYRYLLGDIVSANVFDALMKLHASRAESEFLDTRENLIRTLTATTRVISDDLLDPSALLNLYRINNRDL